MKAGDERGSLTLLTVFIYFLFSALGLGLVYLSQLHLRTGAYRKSTVLLAYAAENGIKQGFVLLAEKAAAAAAPAESDESQIARLRAEIEAGRVGIIGEVLGGEYPFRVEGASGDQAWTAWTEFGAAKLTAADRFFLADFQGTVLSRGRLLGFAPEKAASLDLSLQILAGHVPLAYFPFLLSGGPPPEERDALLQDKNIVLIRPDGAAFPPRPAFMEDEISPDEADLLLKKAARVKFLTPGRLTRAELRGALGLEMVNEPVPEGVYLIQSDLGLGGIFVQGDLDEIVLAVDGEYQAISLRRGEDSWLLKFSPSLGRATFASPGGEGPREFDRTPLGIILVNGAVQSLGGGVMGPGGLPTIVTDAAVPCVLRGVSLTIVASDKMTITSHLVQQGVKWIGSIPYLKDSTSQLILYASGRDLVEDQAKTGKVFIDPHAPREIALQASIAAKSSFESEGASRTILLAGGVQTANLALNGSLLKVLPDERLRDPGRAPENAPATTRSLLAVLSLRPLRWRDTP